MLTFINWMTKSVDPDQMASLEAIWSGSTLFAKGGVVMNSRIRVNPLNAKKTCIWKYCLFMSSAEYSCKLSKPIFAYRQTVWTQIRLLLMEQSDLGPHCLQNDFKNHKQMTKQTIIVVIGSLRVKWIFFRFLGRSLVSNLMVQTSENETRICIFFFFFVYVEVLWPSQPNGVMSSAVSLPNHTFTGQA